MSFLAPLFLLGIAAIAGPIVFHLIRRTTREKQPFSSLMFLQPSPPRISRRHRFEHLLLLLLRCAALALLGLGFARPFFRHRAESTNGAARMNREVILVDVSASMRRTGLWEAARAQALARVRQTHDGDEIALLTFDDRTLAVMSFNDWKQASPAERMSTAAARLQAVTPGWGGSHLGQALVAAAETLEGTDARGVNADKRIVLISDLQAGSRLDSLQGYAWPKDVQVVLAPVKTSSKTNAGLQVLAEAPDAATRSSRVRLRVSNSPAAAREQFQIGWAGSGGAPIGTPIDAYVPAGQSRAFSIAVPTVGAAADRLVLTGDDEPFDNTVFVVPPSKQRASVLWIGPTAQGERGAELTFLQRAFADTSRVDVHVTALASAAALSPGQLEQADLVFVGGNTASMDAAAIRRFLGPGKVAVALLAAGASPGALTEILGRPVPVAEASPDNYAMFGDIDFRHPLFAPFADPRFSDFTKIHVWHYRRVDVSGFSGAHVIARFDHGDPAIVELPVNGGRLILFAMGWEPEDSQLAVSSKFVPMMWSLLEMSGAATASPAPKHVGDALAVPARGATAVLRPDGTTAAIAAGEPAFTDTRERGIYQFISTTGRTRVAVNVDANESRTAPLATDELEQLGVPVRPEQPMPKERARAAALARAADLENRQKAWRWLIAATLLVLLAESIAAAQATRRSAPAQPEAVA
jgi:hypothetical protein